MNIFTKLTFLLFMCVSIGNKSFAVSQCDEGWIQFGDEKCYQLVEKVANWQQAKSLCEDGSNHSTLAMITSQQEQDFIEDYLYRQKHTVDNVWIGGKRTDDNSEFRWIDGTKLDFTHWRMDGPIDDDNKNCIEMISSVTTIKLSPDARVGEWVNTECNKHNFVTLCEKPQDIDFNNLRKLVINLKKEFESEKKVLKDTIAQMQSIESDLKTQLQSVKKEYKKLNDTLHSVKEENIKLNNTLNLQSEIINKLKEENKYLCAKYNETTSAIKILTKDENKLKSDIKELSEKIDNSDPKAGKIYLVFLNTFNIFFFV